MDILRVLGIKKKQKEYCGRKCHYPMPEPPPICVQGTNKRLCYKCGKEVKR